MTNKHTDEMREHVLGQALITITRQEYECIKLATTHYQDALREVGEALQEARLSRRTMQSCILGALATIKKALGDKT